MRVAVFTGSRSGPPAHAEAAAAFATGLAAAGVGIVYGGGRVGLMGVVADAAELLSFVGAYEQRPPGRRGGARPGQLAGAALAAARGRREAHRAVSGAAA